MNAADLTWIDIIFFAVVAIIISVQTGNFYGKQVVQSVFAFGLGLMTAWMIAA